MTHAQTPQLTEHHLFKGHDGERLRAALLAVEGCGAGLLAVRHRSAKQEERDGQLKTAIDRAAEGWVLGYLSAVYEKDLFLAEEAFESQDEGWPGAESYWTVDALDGTRSFVDGFDGFVVQTAFVRDGAPVVAALSAPAFGTTWGAVRGRGAFVWRQGLSGGAPERLSPLEQGDWPLAPRFIDSTVPGGPVGEVFHERGGVFVESGSIGLKAIRVAEGEVDVFAKALKFKLWDVAPADLVLSEVGGALGTWDGHPIDYRGSRVVYSGILAAPVGLFRKVADALAPHLSTSI